MITKFGDRPSTPLTDPRRLVLSMILCPAVVTRKAAHSYVSDWIGFAALLDVISRIVRRSLDEEGGTTSRSPDLSAPMSKKRSLGRL
jgi:hypothetical protein